MLASFQTLHFLYDIFYYTSSAFLSVADPITDLLVAGSYFWKGDENFGIATLVLFFLPSVILSALSIQWVVFDTSVTSVIEKLKEEDKYCAPRDYTEYFLMEEAKATTNTEEGPGKDRHIFPLNVGDPEQGEVEVDAPPLTRDLSRISMDAGVSRLPVIITGTTIGRRGAYRKAIEELKAEPEPFTCGKLGLCSLVCHLLGLPGVPRYISLFRQTLRIRRRKAKLKPSYEGFVKEAAEKGIKEVYFNKDLLELYHGRRDAAFLRLVEGALEATPQLLLQLYIIVKFTQWSGTAWYTLLSVAISFSSVVWSMTSYINEHRAASYNKASLSVAGYILLVLIKCLMCLARIVAILLAITISGYVVLGVLAVHWLSCLIYVAFARTHFYGGLVWNEWFFKLVTSITLILVFINIVEGKSRVRWGIYHGYTGLQNLGLVLFWYFNMASHHWYTNALIGLVVGATLLGSLLSLLYYRFFHPSKTPVMHLTKIRPTLERLKAKHLGETDTRSERSEMHVTTI